MYEIETLETNQSFKHRLKQSTIRELIKFRLAKGIAVCNFGLES